MGRINKQRILVIWQLNEREWSKINNHLKDLISKFTSNGALISFLKSWLSSWKSDLFDTLEPYWNLLVHQPRRQHFIDVLGHRCGRRESSSPHSSDPPRTTDQRPNFSGINLGVCHGTRWNMMELYFGGGHMRPPTRIWWENMEKHGKTTNPSRPFRRFEVAISFRISQALTIQQNTLSEIKDGTILEN